MKIVIIGGSGFVSGTLAREAVSKGHQVWVVTRGQRQLPSGVTALKADRHDLPATEAAIESAGTSFDLAVDCIGYNADDARQDVELFRSRAKHFVFVSTDFVFDPTKRQVPQNEDNAHFIDLPYGGGKRKFEAQLQASDTGDMGWTIVRPGHIYGPGSHLGCLPNALRDATLIDRMRKGEPIELVGEGFFLQQPIFVTDLTNIILACPSCPAANKRIFHTAGPDVVQSSSYYQIIAEILGVKVAIREIPIEPFRQANPLRVSYLCHRVYDLSPIAMADLPMPAVGIKEGLRRSVEWSLAQAVRA